MKKIIGMHFGTKSYLKSTHNHTAKHALKLFVIAFRVRDLMDLNLDFVFGPSCFNGSCFALGDWVYLYIIKFTSWRRKN